jgi:hypothetical protein
VQFFGNRGVLLNWIPYARKGLDALLCAPLVLFDRIDFSVRPVFIPKTANKSTGKAPRCPCVYTPDEAFLPGELHMGNDWANDRLLKFMLALLQHEHVGLAAEHLNTTPSNVSDAAKQFLLYSGLRLYYLDKKECVHPTRAGVAFCEMVVGSDNRFNSRTNLRASAGMVFGCRSW